MTRLRSLVLQVGIGVFVIASFGCTPKNRNMLVASVEGDIFLPYLRLNAWEYGEARDCEIASMGSVRPDQRGDLLLCGEKTRLAWSQTWLRADIKNQIYEAAKEQPVNFHSSGRPGGRGESPIWRCTRRADRFDCE